MRGYQLIAALAFLGHILVVMWLNYQSSYRFLDKYTVPAMLSILLWAPIGYHLEQVVP